MTATAAVGAVIEALQTTRTTRTLESLYSCACTLANFNHCQAVLNQLQFKEIPSMFAQTALSTVGQTAFSAVSVFYSAMAQLGCKLQTFSALNDTDKEIYDLSLQCHDAWSDAVNHLVQARQNPITLTPEPATRRLSSVEDCVATAWSALATYIAATVSQNITCAANSGSDYTAAQAHNDTVQMVTQMVGPSSGDAPVFAPESFDFGDEKLCNMTDCMKIVTHILAQPGDFSRSTLWAGAYGTNTDIQASFVSATSF